LEIKDPVVATGFYASSIGDENTKPTLLAVKSRAGSAWVDTFAAASFKCGDSRLTTFRKTGSVTGSLGSGIKSVPAGAGESPTCKYGMEAKPLDSKSEVLGVIFKIKETDKAEVTEAVLLVRVEESVFLNLLKAMKSRYPDISSEDQACEAVSGKKCLELFQPEPVPPVDALPER